MLGSCSAQTRSIVSSGIGGRPTLRVVRRNQRRKPAPGNHRVDLSKELLAPRHLLFQRIALAGKSRSFQRLLDLNQRQEIQNLRMQTARDRNH